jgi:hypothetical protein
MMTTYRTLTRTAATLALGLALLTPGPAVAGARNKYIDVLAYHWGIGVVPGQIARVTVIHPGSLTADSEPAPKFIWYMTIETVDGQLLKEVRDIQIAAGESYSFDFDPRVSGLKGEPGTGRLQLRVEVAIEELIVEGESETVIPVPLELFDARTGATQVALVLPRVQTVRKAADQ